MKHCGKQNRAFQSKWFSEFPWLHYNEQSDSVLCFICMQQNAKNPGPPTKGLSYSLSWHSLSLSAKDTTKNCKLLSDTMETAKEIVSVIKFSPKRENLLGEIKENLEGPESEAKGILGLCPTRWTVRASCFQRILDKEWTISLDEKLQSNIRGRIIGCQAQINTFDFFFGLNLGQRLFFHTDNLSRTLQQTKMSALSGKRVACLTKDVLQKMRNDTSFRSFLWKVKAIPPWVDRCYQGELARQEELKLALESQHILWPHKTITGEYTLKLLTWWWTLLTSGLTSQALIRMQRWSLS